MLEHAFDEVTRVLTLACEEHFRGRFGAHNDVMTLRRIAIRAHGHGLRVEDVRFEQRGRMMQRSVTIVPGEYALDEVSRYIAEMARVEPVVISDLLLETELWYDRGFVDDPKNFPAAIFKRVPLKEFVRGSLKSYKTWIRAVFYSGPAFIGVSKERIEKNIRDGTYPEKLHAIKHWLGVTMADLRFAVRYGVWRHAQWGVFVSQYYPLYGEVLRRHPEAWREPDAFVRCVLKFPKTERVRDLVDRLYNLGGSVERAIRCRSARELAAYVDVLAEQQSNAPLKVTLFEYVPPDIDVPSGWKLADKTTFWTLGEKFNCCINRNGYYANRLKTREAVVAYNDGNLAGDGGALAFFVRDAGKWVLQEIGGWSNRLALSSYGDEADAIVAQLRRWDVRKGGRLDRPHHLSTSIYLAPTGTFAPSVFTPWSALRS